MSAVLDFGRPVVSGKSAASRAALCRRLADATESIIALLDALDGDPEAEDCGDAEPSLGWTATMAWGSTDDREENIAEVLS